MGSLAILNLWNFEENAISFKIITDIDSLITKIIYSAPLVWIAIVANVNLNKYSRLEEEYAHKESLAKSFERYKLQISELESPEDSKELMTKLLFANIGAFEKNAADTMNKAKSDTFFNSFSKKSKVSKQRVTEEHNEN